jgi:oligopeptide/dipeptide ABC transporter ATP-binding protein
VAVMYCGRIVEIGSAEHIFFDPRHPYTRGLLASLPRIDRRMDKLHPLQGSVPDHHEMPRGCAFEPRCPYALQECIPSLPAFVGETDGHRFACFNPQVGRLPL